MPKPTRHQLYGETYVSIERIAKSPTRNGLAVALSLAIAAIGTASAASGPRTVQAPPSWAATATRAFDVGNAAIDGFAQDTHPVSIVVTLKLRNEALMDSYIAEQHRPGSPAYHQWLNSAEATEYFSPTEDEAQAVADYLTAQGFEHVEIAPNRLLVSASGDVGSARHAFNTEFVRVSRGGEEGIANIGSAQVPAAIAGQVQAVLGLQTVEKMQVYSHAEPAFVSAARVPAQGVGSNGYPYYLPHDFQIVYHAGTTSNGRQTNVAVVGWGSMTSSVADLAHYESDYGISAVPTSVVTVGGSSTDNSGEGEWALDAEAIVGISAGVKSLTFYAAHDAYNSTLATTLNRVVTDNTVKVVNMSWGGGESAASFADSIFKTGVTQGQTFSAASGDHGSYNCGSLGNNGTYGTKRCVSDPANSPYVIAVGGTTLTTDANSNYVSETTWPYSGGGVSKYEAKPAWQSALSGSYRQVPDVAFDADWTKSGIAYYVNGSQGAGYYVNGGTSLASPLFVGAWARLESANNNTIGFAPKALYAYSSTFPFHDITTGKNGPSATYYSAKVGYDNTTGWGSFDIQAAATFISSTPGFITKSNQ